MAMTEGQQVTQARSYDEHTGWVGWIAFAATMMIIGGSLNILYGLVAVVNDTWVGWNAATSNAVVVDLTAWGWVHMGVGLLVLLAGLGVLSGNVLARTIGVIVAGLSMIANFFFIPVYPWWSLTIIVIDALVIWALTAHGREMRVND
jgi:hypothetical protein